MSLPIEKHGCKDDRTEASGGENSRHTLRGWQNQKGAAQDGNTHQKQPVKLGDSVRENSSQNRFPVMAKP
ncbi:MAG: hypothetical protein K9L70_01540 [Thiohalocapsa sp.]|nr:hypothetical protein [Thiohalocapsa sp.]MCF7990902.1 hypothetical protein [Thiohalocapsa sp.]